VDTGGLTPRRSPVQYGEKADLSVADARRELDLLEQEDQAGKTVTIKLSWQITEKEGKA
jgi:hypothetical protein